MSGRVARAWKRLTEPSPSRAALLGGLTLLPLAAFFIAGGLLSRPPPDPANPADPGQVAAPAFAVRNPAGAQIGEVRVDYPRSMRENEARPLVVRYVASPRWRGAFAAWRELRIEAEVSGSRLTVGPEPRRYVFRNDRIAARGEDSRGWDVSPQSEGSGRIRLRLEAEPATFTVAVAAGGASAGPGNDLSLPVTVYTRYSVPQIVVDLVKGTFALAAFLAGLPFLSSMVRWASGDRAPPPGPGGASAVRGPRPRGGRRRR